MQNKFYLSIIYMFFIYSCNQINTVNDKELQLAGNLYEEATSSNLEKAIEILKGIRDDLKLATQLSPDSYIENNQIKNFIDNLDNLINQIGTSRNIEDYDAIISQLEDFINNYNSFTYCNDPTLNFIFHMITLIKNNQDDNNNIQYLQSDLMPSLSNANKVSPLANLLQKLSSSVSTISSRHKKSSVEPSHNFKNINTKEELSAYLKVKYLKLFTKVLELIQSKRNDQIKKNTSSCNCKRCQKKVNKLSPFLNRNFIQKGKYRSAVSLEDASSLRREAINIKILPSDDPNGPHIITCIKLNEIYELIQKGNYNQASETYRKYFIKTIPTRSNTCHLKKYIKKWI